MSFKSVLGAIGHGILVALHVTEAAAVIATPIVATAAPEIAGLYSGLLGAAFSAEAAANGASGSGPQKLAIVVAGQLPNILSVLNKNGIQMNNDQITKWASAVVDTLNLIPSPTVTTNPVPVGTTVS